MHASIGRERLLRSVSQAYYFFGFLRLFLFGFIGGHYSCLSVLVGVRVEEVLLLMCILKAFCWRILIRSFSEMAISGSIAFGSLIPLSPPKSLRTSDTIFEPWQPIAVVKPIGVNRQSALCHVRNRNIPPEAIITHPSIAAHFLRNGTVNNHLIFLMR